MLWDRKLDKLLRLPSPLAFYERPDKRFDEPDEEEDDELDPALLPNKLERPDKGFDESDEDDEPDPALLPNRLENPPNIEVTELPEA